MLAALPHRADFSTGAALKCVPAIPGSSSRPRRCGSGVVVLAHVDDFLHELRIAHGQSILIEPRVVLETRPAVAAGFQAPPIHLPLVAPDAGCNPGRAGSTSAISARRKSKIERRAGVALGMPSTNWTCGGLLSKPFFTRLAAL